MPRILCLFTLILFFAACNDKQPDTATPVEEPTWYRRYTGTIAGQQVVVNLVKHIVPGEDGKDETVIDGNYCYRGKSRILDIQDKGSKNGKITFAESAPAKQKGDNGATEAVWVVSFNGDSITGKWGGNGKEYDIALRENYDGGYRMKLYSDTGGVDRKRASVVTTYNLLLPANGTPKADSLVMIAGLLQALGDTTTNGTVQSFLNVTEQKWTKLLDDVVAEDTSAHIMNGDWEYIANASCLYNDRNMLVIEAGWYGFTGGAHGNYGGRYACIDVRNRKILRLADVVAVDSVRLSKLLRESAEQTIGVDDSPVSDMLMENAIPATEKFFISDVGITFCYDPYEIAPYAVGSISLFIPYAKLGDMLRPEFKTRMELK